MLLLTLQGFVSLFPRNLVPETANTKEIDSKEVDKIGNNRKSTRSRGRPSLQDSQIIQKDIKKYFVDGFSAYFCMNKTGYAKNTVYTYYKEWTEELIDRTDFIGQQIEAKFRLVMLLDNSLHILHDQLKFLLSKRTNKFNSSLENAILKCNCSLWQLHVDKASVLMAPTLDISLRKVILEKWGIDIEEAAQNSNNT